MGLFAKTFSGHPILPLDVGIVPDNATSGLPRTAYFQPDRQLPIALRYIVYANPIDGCMIEH